jgi:tetratricopeptide (TPR) repeat protein
MKAFGHILLAVLAGLALWASVLGLGVLRAAESGRNPAIVMQEAIYQEETEGNLDKAIELYGQVLDQAADVERLAARATYQLGLCHLKKGDQTAAADYFRKVASNYPQQTSVVQKANEQLEKIEPKTKDSVFEQIDYQTIRFISEQFGKVALEANQQHLAVNSHVYYADPNGYRYSGGMNAFYNWTGRTIAQKVKLTGMTGSDYTFYGVNGQELNTEFVQDKERSNHYYVYWIPDEPLAPEEFLYYGWSTNTKRKLPQLPGNAYSLMMQNQFGDAVIETFFLVLPKTMKIAQSATPPTGTENLLNFDVYWWSKQVPQGEDHVEAVSIEKTEVPMAKMTPLELSTLPFFDGEAMRLKLSTPAGMEIGQMIWQCRSFKEGDVFYDRIESYMHIGIQNFQQYTAVDTQRNSFLPVRGLSKNEMGTFEANYSEEAVTLKTTINGNETVRNFDVSGAVYDNEQALYVIRSLPLAVGYEVEFNIFPVQSASIARCKIRVTDIQKIPWAGGEMECFAVKLAVYSGDIKALEHDLWISTDERRWLVKYDSGQAIMELMGAGKSDLSQLQRISEGGLNYEFAIPAGWQFIHSANPEAYKISVQLLPPELTAWAVFTGIEKTGLPNSIKEIAEGDIEILKGFFKNYTVRPESWLEQQIKGDTAATYTADYEDKGRNMVEYRTYIMTDSLVYWFVFRIEKERFEEEKTTLDSIVNSFNPKA